MASYPFDYLMAGNGATLVSPGVVSFAPGANRFAYLRAGAPVRPRGAYSSTIETSVAGTYIGFLSSGTSQPSDWILDKAASTIGPGYGGHAYVFPPASTPQTITWTHLVSVVYVLIYAPVGGGTFTISPATELPAIIEGQPGTIPLPPVPPTIVKLIPASGPDTGGTTVDIIGANLTGASIDFGGTAGTGLTVDPSGGLATVTSPAHTAGPYPVTITTPAGTSNAATFLFTPPGAPTLTGIDPTEGPETGGTTALLTGTNLAGTIGVDFGGSPATIITVTDTALLVTTPAHAAGTVDVTATDGATTTDPLAFEFAEATGPVIDGPDVIANLVALLTAELGVPVSSRRSPTATKDSDPSVVVRRTGGPSKGVASDNPTVTIEAWAPTTTESFQLLQSARMVVIEAAEQGRAGLRRYDEFAGPADLPDPSTTNPRHTLTASVVTRLE